VTPERIAELKKLAEAATPGKWLDWNEWVCLRGGFEGPEEIVCTAHLIGEIDQDEKNAAFIAASRTAVPELIAEVERLQSGYLADENGNEYVQVCILKEKIREQAARLAAARDVLEEIASWANGCPANSEYDKGLKAAHDALSSKARAWLEANRGEG
jgi:hypothetical protein